VAAASLDCNAQESPPQTDYGQLRARNDKLRALMAKHNLS